MFQASNEYMKGQYVGESTEHSSNQIQADIQRTELFKTGLQKQGPDLTWPV